MEYILKVLLMDCRQTNKRRNGFRVYTCHYIGSNWMECDNGNMIEQRRACMFVSINLCVDLACTLFIQSTYPLHRQSIIHQPKSIDVVITTPRALGRWSHTDQSCNSDQILLPATDLSNSSDQKSLTQ